MISPARRAAYEITLAVDAERLDLASALADLRDRLTDARDRALATDIAVGAQRWRGQIDYLLAESSGRALARLDAEVLAILRLSAYQLLHLTRVPAAAVVNDAVELVRVARKRSAAGLVNAVLRKLSTQPPALPTPPDHTLDARAARAQAVAYLSVTQSHPAWLVERWLDRYGWEASRSWVAFNNEVAPLTLWPGPAALQTPSGMNDWPAGAPTTWVPGGVVLHAGHEAMPWLQSGCAYAQDEASAAVAAVAASMAQPPVFDACAAPGGKSIVLAAALSRDDLLVAGDVRSRRVATLRGLLNRVAGRTIPVVRADARAIPFAGTLGTLLIDAPCSGLGTLRREPDLRWRRTAGDVQRCADVQRAMLRDALQAVRPGGRVVYATCSSEPEENEDLMAEFVRASGWTLADLRQVPLPGRLHDAVTPDGWLRTLPHAHGLESFFAAVLRRPGADDR